MQQLIVAITQLEILYAVRIMNNLEDATLGIATSKIKI